MPAKGKKVASRQAALNRRRRQRRNVDPLEAVIPAVGVEPAHGDGSMGTDALVQPSGAQPANPPPGAARTAARPVAPASRTTQPVSDRAMAYTHLGSELRRILILSGCLLAILVTLSFFL